MTSETIQPTGALWETPALNSSKRQLPMGYSLSWAVTTNSPSGIFPNCLGDEHTNQKDFGDHPYDPSGKFQSSAEMWQSSW